MHLLSRSALLFSLSVAACTSADGKPPPSAPPSAPTSATPAPPSGSASAAAAPKPSASPSSAKAVLPPELDALAPGAKLQAGPFAWPPGGSSAVVANDTESKLIWKTASAKGEVRLPRAAANGVVKDVHEGGAPELVLFAAPGGPALEWFEDPTMTWIVGVDSKAKKPLRMWRLELEVLGATDEPSLDKELAVTGLGPTTAPLPRQVVRLAKATPAEFQELVGKQGVKSCHRQAEKRTCTPVAQESLDAKKVKELVDKAGVTGDYETDPDGEPFGNLQPPHCQVDEKDPKRVDCTASLGGPAGGQWVFEKTDTGYRLAEIASWAEDS